MTHKVNYYGIYDVLGQEEVNNEEIINEIYQEEEAYVLRSFKPTEEVVEPSSLVRIDIQPIFVPE